MSLNQRVFRSRKWPCRLSIVVHSTGMCVFLFLVIRVITIHGLESLCLLSLELGDVDERHLRHVDVNATRLSQEHGQSLLDVVSLQEILQILTTRASSAALVELQTNEAKTTRFRACVSDFGSKYELKRCIVQVRIISLQNVQRGKDVQWRQPASSPQSCSHPWG